MDLGFIGLGQMGFHMARRLIEAGHRLVVLDQRPEAVGRLTALGARQCASPRDMADEVDTILASLPTPDVVLAVATGRNGVIEGKRVRRFIDLSTTGAVMVSGPREEVKTVEPALSVLGKVFFISERPGAGQTMKLCNNFLSAAAMTATSEAMVMGVKAGLDPRLMLDVINAGSGRNTATEDKFGRVVLPRLFNLGFTTGLMTKDVKLCLAEAEALGVPMEVGEAVSRMLQLACDEIGPDKDLTTVIQTVERRAGVEVHAPLAGGALPK